MNIPCPKKSLCLDPADPRQNFSAEAPDQNLFFGVSSGPGSYSGTASGPGSGGPRPGDNWIDDSCDTAAGPITCSALTQADADLCAEQLSVICDPPPGGPPPGGSPTESPTGDTMFLNRSQSCVALCSDGSPFTYTVRAGLFSARSQILSDRMASSYACRQAALNKVCLGTITSGACLGSAYSSTLQVTGQGPFTFTVTAGALPPGLILVAGPNSAIISGTPTAFGSFSFTVRAINALGNFMAKPFSIAVLAITTDKNLPAYSTGSPYSQQITGVSGTPPYTFQLSSGSLPSGMTMSATGLISGTAAGAQNTAFVVKMTDATGNTCSKTFILNAAAIGYEICNWTTVKGILTGFGACTPNGLPEWAGVFDKVIAIDFPLNDLVAWYFTGQAISGRSFSADLAPNYPINDWQDTDCYTSLQQLGPSNWHLFIECSDPNCLGGTELWRGTCTTADPNTPTGIYTRVAGSSAGPATITVVPVADPSCCVPPGEDTTIPVPATVALAQGFPQPARVQVSGIAGVLTALGSCSFCFQKTIEPQWDGKWPGKQSTPGIDLFWTTEAVPAVCGTAAMASIAINSGVVQSVPIVGATPCRIVLQYDAFDVGAPFWLLKITCINPVPANPLLTIWVGAKRYGTDPTGTYTRQSAQGAGIGMADGPACIHIETY